MQNDGLTYLIQLARAACIQTIFNWYAIQLVRYVATIVNQPVVDRKSPHAKHHAM